MATTTPDMASTADNRLETFFGWFRKLSSDDQDALMKLVYNEYKIREVVSNFSTMTADQRQTVFQRLGLPNDLLSRIAPPTPGAVGEVEVEWQEWNSDSPS